MLKDRPEVTVVMVSFHSIKLIVKPINCIDKEINIIVVENSNSKECKDFLEKKFPNVKVILSEKNLGNGGGINLGLKQVKTKYAFYLDIDTEIKEDTIKNLLIASTEIDNFTILAPLVENYKYKKVDYFESSIMENKEHIQMSFVPGCAIFFNMEKILQIGFFDENFFLFFEENDIYMRCLKNNHKIYLIQAAKMIHTGEMSVDKKYDLDIELIRNWHYMWSKFYFYKKHFNIYTAYRETLGHFFSGLVKLLFFLFLNKKNYLKYKFRVLGLLNSYLGNKSWKRPNIN
tara:strand:+ start:327 stop:1190 length:864 start_codon:yes stop_codon:yes gene_type:complete